MLREDNFSIINKTKGKIPNLPILAMKNDILGEKYCLSLVFIDKKKSQELNKRYRDKDNATNILSFPLSKTDGEILICPAVVRTQTKDFDKNFDHLLGFLVIHGMLHLKGMEHSKKMEKLESLYCKKFKFK